LNLLVSRGLGAQGDVLLFEANATMIVQHPDQGEKWDYRRPAVNRIHTAVHRIFLRRAGVSAFPAASSESVAFASQIAP